MRLIDADALIEDVDGDLTDSIAECRAIEKIMNAPTIEERKTVSDEEWTKLRGGWTNQPDRELVEQIRWERDVAIDQLKELGYGFGEKPRRDADCISRQAAIDALRTCQTYLFHTYDPDKKISLESAEFEIEQLPSVQLGRKTGKWIDGKVKHIENGELRNVRECSECGSSYFVYDNYNSLDEIPNFCPNCGADMRGEGHE